MTSIGAIPWIDVCCSSCEWYHGDGVACTSLPDTPDPCIIQNNSQRIIFHEYKKGRGEYSRISLWVFTGFSQGRGGR